MTRTLKNLTDVDTLAAEIAGSLHGGDVLLLSGPLGAGKTTFTQALAKALGITEKVNSPSYTIAGEYDLPAGGQVSSGHASIKKLVHVDLYRLETNAAADPAVRDFLEQVSEPGRVTIIEWAERLPVKSLPAFAKASAGRRGARAYWIKFDYGSTADERIVTVEVNGTST